MAMVLNSNRTLFLHIGAHKTGTTAIQQFLKSRTLELKSIGWDLFHKMPNGFDSEFGNANTWIRFSGSRANFRARVLPSLIEELSKGKLNTILSAEELFWIDDERDIGELYNSLAEIYSQIVICCYLRRQDQHLLSHYQQGFKFPYSSAFQFYGSNLCIVPEHENYYQRYLDYNKKLEIWQRLVGENNLIVKEYSKEKLLGGDAVSDFVQCLPFQLSKATSIKRTNESLSNTQVIINHTLFKIRKSLWYELGGDTFTRKCSLSNNLKPRLPEKTKRHVLNVYNQSNTKLTNFIPDLSKGWISVNKKNIDKTLPSNFSTSDYETALTSVLKYYDDISLFKFTWIKLRKLMSSFGLREKVQSILLKRKQPKFQETLKG